MARPGEPINFLMIGNPGTGKSTMLNGLVGQALFKSGVSYGEGMTFQFDKHKVGAHTYMDTPGLADTKLRKQAAEAITEALKQNGYYKIFFVVVLQNGRVKAEDVTTMRLVLDAAPIENFGIIINQVPPGQYRDLTENPKGESPTPFDKVCSCLLPAMSEGKASLRIQLVKRDGDLEDAANTVKELPAELKMFMESTPGMMICSSQVAEVEGKGFEEIKADMESKLQDMLAKNESLEKALAQQNLNVANLTQQLHAQRADMEKRLAQARADADESVRQAQANFAQQMAEAQENFQTQLQQQQGNLQADLETMKEQHNEEIRRLEREAAEARKVTGWDVFHAVVFPPTGIPNLLSKE